MRKKGKKIIIPAGGELMDYLNRGYAICNKCGAVMDCAEDSKGGCDIYVCPSCRWKIDELEYAYESGDSMELVQDERGRDCLILRNDMPPAGCRACKGPLPFNVGGRKESPYMIGMFHDLCKTDQYRRPQQDAVSLCAGDGQSPCEMEAAEWEHDSNTLLKGHGDKSVMMLSRYFQLTMEEILCIRYHMGAFVGREEWNDYTRAIQAFPNILWTHHADMIAAHILEAE